MAARLKCKYCAQRDRLLLLCGWSVWVSNLRKIQSRTNTKASPGVTVDLCGSRRDFFARSKQTMSNTLFPFLPGAPRGKILCCLRAKLFQPTGQMRQTRVPQGGPKFLSQINLLSTFFFVFPMGDSSVHSFKWKFWLFKWKFGRVALTNWHSFSHSVGVSAARSLF